ncbi:hypothetical protein, partial [Heyndrickxia coagulans]
RNSSPTYSLVRFAPSHSLRMGDFFRKAVKLRCLRINLLISPENMRRLAFILLLVPHSFGMGVCLQIWVQQRLI